MTKMTIGVLTILAAVLTGRVVMAETDAETRSFIGGERIELRFDPPSIAGGDIKDQVVREDGSVTLPTGSFVLIKGKNLSEAKKVIGDQLQKDTGAKAVQVRILILEYPASKVFVAGEVRMPKAILLTPSVPMTLFFALLECGGISEKGDPTRVTLLRQDADGKQRNQFIDTTKLARGESGDLGPKLISGDVIVVPPAEHFVFNGEFTRTGYMGLGEMHLEPIEKPHLSRAILAVGGIKREGDISKLKIMRLRPDGSREVLMPLAETSTVKDPVLQNGDIIDVPAKPGQKDGVPFQNTQSVTITGKVRAPGIFPIGESGLKLSRLILAAGGTTEFARGKKVTINRPSENGRLIEVDVEGIIKKGRWEQDVDLMDGDVVNVPERGW